VVDKAVKSRCGGHFRDKLTPLREYRSSLIWLITYNFPKYFKPSTELSNFQSIPNNFIEKSRED
jgi:hypothetical protein